jgi:sugar lactone lactonase YvrE
MTTTTPAPRPLCAAFAPLLPLLSSGALEEDEATPTREHVAGCAWCQQELARYAAVDEALRREFGAGAHASVLPLLFDLDRGEDCAEDYAFTLEDTLEETMAEGHDPRDLQQSTTARSSRWSERKRRPSPRVTAIAGIAAALILAVIATTIYTKFAPQRTASPAATKTSGAFTKVALPTANAVYAWTTGSDGGFWYANSSHSAEIGRVAPDGTVATFPIPTDDAVKQVYVNGMAFGSDGNLWFSGSEDRGTTYPQFIERMTPAGVFTTIPMPANLGVGRMIAGPDGAVWFAGDKNPDQGTSVSVIGRITMDGQITTFPTLSQGKDGGVHDFCVGPDQAIWYTWISSLNDPSKLTGRIGSISPSGQIQEFAVPYAPGSIVSGADGALWYSEFTPGAPGDDLARKGFLGRITTSGVATELPIDPNVSIDQVAAGSDGAIWYVAYPDQTGAFGRIAPSGEVKMFSTGGNAQIYLIAAVSGALWLFDSRNNLWHYRLPA